uniref:Uncharacterized protein n=1 Tax=Anguilla anguilla TaxID=7936 RepID=A0A0E9WFT9_ANGAN
MKSSQIPVLELVQQLYKVRNKYWSDTFPLWDRDGIQWRLTNKTQQHRGIMSLFTQGKKNKQTKKKNTIASKEKIIQ